MFSHPIKRYKHLIQSCHISIWNWGIVRYYRHNCSSHRRWPWRSCRGVRRWPACGCPWRRGCSCQQCWVERAGGRSPSRSASTTPAVSWSRPSRRRLDQKDRSFAVAGASAAVLRSAVIGEKDTRVSIRGGGRWSNIGDSDSPSGHGNDYYADYPYRL